VHEGPELVVPWDAALAVAQEVHRREVDEWTPAITVYRRGGPLIDEYSIFVDLSPVYA